MLPSMCFCVCIIVSFLSKSEFVRSEKYNNHNHQNQHNLGSRQHHQPANGEIQQMNQHNGGPVRNSTNENTEFIKNEQQLPTHRKPQPQPNQIATNENSEFIKTEQQHHRQTSQHADHHHGSGLRRPVNTGGTEEFLKHEHPTLPQHQHNHQHPNQHQHHHHRNHGNTQDLIKNERYATSPHNNNNRGESKTDKPSTTIPSLSSQHINFNPKTDIVISSPLRGCPAGSMRDFTGRCRSIFN